MNIVVINGTPQQGVTHLMKEEFLRHFREGNTITEFYPADMPTFCTGCKTCFMRDAALCPHAEKTMPIWNAMLGADVIVFAYPVYVMRAPGAVKSLLDHLGVRWVVHRPEPAMFSKTAVIITNSIGAPNGAAQRDVKTSLNWMGVSRVYTSGMGMMGDIFPDQMSAAHRRTIAARMAKLAERVRRTKPASRMSMKVQLLFTMARFEHRMVFKGEEVPGADSRHWIEHGWLKA